MRIQLLTILMALSILSCKQEKEKRNTIVTKGYELKSANDKKGAGTLSYIITEEFTGDKLMQKVHMDKYENIKGIEKYIYKNSNTPDELRYYDKEGNLLSSYKLEYKNGKKISAEGYEGNFQELLRVEKYIYDSKGNRERKEIYNSHNVLQRYQTFAFDSLGNEVKFVDRDAATNKIILQEDYEIVEMDTLGRWMKKWGYRNGSSFPTSVQEKSASDYR